MNKELTPLEAFYNIRCNCNQNYPDFEKNKNIVETALKRLEILEEEKQSFDRQFEKKVKALEIIKRSPVMIVCEIYKCAIELKMSYEEYCDYFSKDEQSIKSKEEYDLLKEVLL